MHTGKSYRLVEFLVWTRRSIYLLLVLSIVPVVLYQVVGLEWIKIPWGVVFLLGTTVALASGFKNTQTYNRTWEAQQVWSSIISTSRTWGAMSRDLAGGSDAPTRLVYRHLAWLTALRYGLREPRAWETVTRASNAEYRKRYAIPEKDSSLAAELAKYVSGNEAASILFAATRPTEALGLQSADLRRRLDDGSLSMTAFIELQKLLRELGDLQAKAERLKNFPYPRQYAVVNVLFVRILCLLLPLGMISELEQMDAALTGAMHGHMVWLAIPLSVLISWMYTSLDQVGDSTANPFEGGANDVPIAQICRTLEWDLRELLGETDLDSLASRKADINL